MRNEDSRPINILEFEFTQALENNDNESIIDLLKERPDLISFFCSVAIIRHLKEPLRAVINDLPEELESFKLLIKRMSALTAKEIKLLKEQAVESENIEQNKEESNPLFIYPLP